MATKVLPAEFEGRGKINEIWIVLSLVKLSLSTICGQHQTVLEHLTRTETEHGSISV
jgi:hypothetical protein